MAKKLLEGFSREHFAHPYDTSGMHRLMEKLSKSHITAVQIEKMQTQAEDEFYLLNLADNTKLSEKQGGSIYLLVKEVANILSCPIPHVFLDTNPYVNAYALGGENPSIVLTSALIDFFPESTLKVVIAHELGHINCKHTFYRLLANYFDTFSRLLNLIPILGSLLSLSFRWYLLDWYRKSELSADRASLLGTQDIDEVKNCILMLAGGSDKIRNELSVTGYIEQGHEFQNYMKMKREQDLQERVGFLFSGFMLQTAVSTHPWPAVRLMEIDRWEKSEQYKLLIEGKYEEAVKKSQVVKDEEEIIVPPPLGDDIKEYVKDLGKVVGDKFKGFFEQPETKRQVKEDKSIYLEQMKSKSSVRGKTVSYEFFFDATKWKIPDAKTVKYSEYEFIYQNGECYAVIVPDTHDIILDKNAMFSAAKNIIIDLLRRGQSYAAMKHEEKRSVNGEELLCMKIEYIENLIPYIYYGYWYVGNKETIQLYTFTLKNDFDKYYSELTDFLNGLVI